jgi:hypothetical protein
MSQAMEAQDSKGFLTGGPWNLLYRTELQLYQRAVYSLSNESKFNQSTPMRHRQLLLDAAGAAATAPFKTATPEHN